MIINKTVSLKENIIQYVLDSVNPEHTVFIFPTYKNKAAATNYFQNKWRFSDTAFYSFEEFKSLFFPTEFPLISSDKRKLLLYSVITDEFKDTLKITDYFSSIGFLDKFFSFWEEIYDECIDADNLISILEEKSGALLLNSQKEYYQQLYYLLSSYKNILNENNLTDRIFQVNKNNIHIPETFEEKIRFVFVNQYYFSNLENSILKELSDQGKNCVKINQFTRSSEDIEQEDISFDNNQDLRLKHLNIIEVPDSYSMYFEFLKFYENEKDSIVLNNSSNDEVNTILSHKYRMSAGGCDVSYLFSFLSSLVDLTENVNFLDDNKLMLFSLEELRSFFSGSCNHRILDNYAEKFHKIISDKLIRLYVKESYLTISFEKLISSFSKEKYADTINVLQFYKSLIEKLNTGNLPLINFLNYLFESVSFIVDKKQWESFWKAYNDFCGIIDRRFPVDVNKIFSRNICLNYLKLFLDIYKTGAKINSAGESLEVTLLNNTRNVFPVSPVIVVHAEEGVIPSSPKKTVSF